jgi:hypothetical protein
MRQAIGRICAALAEWFCDLSDLAFGVDTKNSTETMSAEAMRALSFCADLDDLEDGEVISVQEYERRIRIGMKAATWH